jgi:hypothetical protein
MTLFDSKVWLHIFLPILVVSASVSGAKPIQQLSEPELQEALISAPRCSLATVNTGGVSGLKVTFIQVAASGDESRGQPPYAYFAEISDGKGASEIVYLPITTRLGYSGWGFMSTNSAPTNLCLSIEGEFDMTGALFDQRTKTAAVSMTIKHSGVVSLFAKPAKFSGNCPL